MVRTPNFHDKDWVQSLVGNSDPDKPHSMFPPKKKKTQPKTPKPSESILKDGHSKHERGRNQNCYIPVALPFSMVGFLASPGCKFKLSSFLTPP